jgi:hypothetical protein
MTEIDRLNSLNYNLGIVKFQLKSYDKYIEIIKNNSHQTELASLLIDLDLFKDA